MQTVLPKIEVVFCPYCGRKTELDNNRYCDCAWCERTSAVMKAEGKLFLSPMEDDGEEVVEA